MTLAICNPPGGAFFGPASSLDNQFLRFDGTNGDTVQVVLGMFADDNGNVGIGVSDPCSLLELWDDNAHPILSITAAHDTDYDPQIQFRTDATDTVKFSMGIDAGDSDKFKIFSGEGIGGTSEFVIDGNGNIGIGISSPAYSLDTGNSIRIRAASHHIRLYDTNTNADEWTITTLQNEHIAFYENGSNRRFLITNDGKIGIGNTVNLPEFTLELVGENALAKIWRFNSVNVTRSPAFLFARSRGTEIYPANVISGDWLGKIQFRGFISPDEENYGAFGFIADDASQNGRFGFFDNDLTTERMTIKTSGNIGINETSPETLLELTSTVSYITLHNSTEEDIEAGRESKLIFKGEQSGGEETTLGVFEMSHDGTSDDEKANAIWQLNSGSDGDSPTEMMRLDSAGNLCLGTTITGSNAAGVIALSNSITAPADSADLCHLYCEDISAGNAALAIYQESAVIAEVDETKFSHKMPIRINGSTYYMMLMQT